jgi:MoaA/NifB/PqqE/SkfB family radical SAM enzyme
MKEVSYKHFSQDAHGVLESTGRMSSCRFELTFGCGFHCRHCMTDCYNRPSLLKKELSAAQVKKVLGKLKAAGVFWLCFSGGDPLSRKDFFEIYDHAKALGFLVTIFTNGAAIDRRMARRLAENPPFVIEITINAATSKLYEKISACQGSYKKVMQALKWLKKEQIPFKVKTQVTEDNIREVPRIKNFVDGLGVSWETSHLLYPRLNGDLTPCALRVAPAALFEKSHKAGLPHGEISCAKSGSDNRLFPCVIDSAAEMNIDPYGFGFFCPLLREPKFDLFKTDIAVARRHAKRAVEQTRLPPLSPCASCGLRVYCPWCPGWAFLEKGDREASVDYCCEIAKGFAAVC